VKKVFIPIFYIDHLHIRFMEWTYGFSAFTIFSYTLKSAGSTPRDFPELKLISQDDKVFDLKKRKSMFWSISYISIVPLCAIK
jgi:hypothetical protein